MLDTLSPEVLEKIIAHVVKKNDLLALSRVSRLFRNLTFRRLFEVVTITVHDEEDLWNFDPYRPYPFFEKHKIARVPKVLAVIKEVHFRAPFDSTKIIGPKDEEDYEEGYDGDYEEGWGRCPHFAEDPALNHSIALSYECHCHSPSSSWEDTDFTVSGRDHYNFLCADFDDSPVLRKDDEVTERKKVKEMCIHELFDFEGGAKCSMLADDLIKLLSAIPDNQLRSFSWDMGTCFPKTILGEGGLLSSHQTGIKKLSLITDGFCRSKSPSLNDFPDLRDLSWRGISRSTDCNALKSCIGVHHERLNALEVGFIDWSRIKNNRDISGTVAIERAGLTRGITPLIDLIIPSGIDDYENFLPELETFSLFGSWLIGSWDLIIQVFDFCSLKSLRLHNCQFAVEMLNYMGQIDVALRATKVELVLCEDLLDTAVCGHQSDDEAWDFLAPFHDLQDMFLMFDSAWKDKVYFEMILRHRDTLRRLVFHRRHCCIVRGAPYWKQFCDVPLDMMGELTFGDILRETKLDSLGICERPWQLQEIFQSMASTVNSLKLLHLRFTGKAERKPKFFEYDVCHYVVPSAGESTQANSEAQTNEVALPNRPQRKKPKNRTTWEQVQGLNWREDEEKELEAFANWAFGPDGFPRLQVLASGDFSHGKRFVDSRKLWCRDTSEPRKQAWRPINENDISENELIDANMDMLSACAVSPLFYSQGQGSEFPGIT